MIRPLYETQKDLDKEHRVATIIEKKSKLRLVKQELHESHIDFLAYNKDDIPTARIEVRCRNYTWEQMDSWGGLMISKKKWQKAIQTVTEEKLAFVLVAEDKNCVLRALAIPKNGPIPKLRSGFDGRSKKNMRDQYDVEDVVYITKEDFNYDKF